MTSLFRCRPLSALGLPVLLMLALAPLALAPLAHTQRASPPLAFEVATVKPVDPGRMTMVDIRVYPGGRLVIHGHTLRTLVANALDVPRWQVVGGDKWLDETRFDIDARPPAEMRDAAPAGEFSNGGITDPRIRKMLQVLLVERFHLALHHETQPGTVLLLKRSDRPLRLQPAQLNLYTRADDGSIAPSHAYPTGDVGMASGAPVGFHQTSMAQLALVLSDMQRTPVHDGTGLSGFYNFRSQTVVSDEDFKAGGPAHLLIDAVPEMGLKLVKTQGDIDRFVIDHADPPTAN